MLRGCHCAHAGLAVPQRPQAHAQVTQGLLAGAQVPPQALPLLGAPRQLCPAQGCALQGPTGCAPQASQLPVCRLPRRPCRLQLPGQLGPCLPLGSPSLDSSSVRAGQLVLLCRHSRQLQGHALQVLPGLGHSPHAHLARLLALPHPLQGLPQPLALPPRGLHLCASSARPLPLCLCRPPPHCSLRLSVPQDVLQAALPCLDLGLCLLQPRCQRCLALGGSSLPSLGPGLQGSSLGLCLLAGAGLCSQGSSAGGSLALVRCAHGSCSSSAGGAGSSNSGSCSCSCSCWGGGGGGGSSSSSSRAWQWGQANAAVLQGQQAVLLLVLLHLLLQQLLLLLQLQLLLCQGQAALAARQAHAPHASQLRCLRLGCSSAS